VCASSEGFVGYLVTTSKVNCVQMRRCSAIVALRAVGIPPGYAQAHMLCKKSPLDLLSLCSTLSRCTDPFPLSVFSSVECILGGSAPHGSHEACHPEASGSTFFMFSPRLSPRLFGMLHTGHPSWLNKRRQRQSLPSGDSRGVILEVSWTSPSPVCPRLGNNFSLVLLSH
jgi:hypothetical protein